MPQVPQLFLGEEWGRLFFVSFLHSRTLLLCRRLEHALVELGGEDQVKQPVDAHRRQQKTVKVLAARKRVSILEQKRVIEGPVSLRRAGNVVVAVVISPRLHRRQKLREEAEGGAQRVLLSIVGGGGIDVCGGHEDSEQPLRNGCKLKVWDVIRKAIQSCRR